MSWELLLRRRVRDGSLRAWTCCRRTGEAGALTGLIARLWPDLQMRTQCTEWRLWPAASQVRLSVRSHGRACACACASESTRSTHTGCVYARKSTRMACEEALCRLTAPWLAGASVDIALFPLDCLKTRMQVVKLDTSFACDVSPTLGSLMGSLAGQQMQITILSPM